MYHATFIYGTMGLNWITEATLDEEKTPGIADSEKLPVPL